MTERDTSERFEQLVRELMSKHGLTRAAAEQMAAFKLGGSDLRVSG